MRVSRVAALAALALSISCQRDKAISEEQAIRTATEYADKNFPKATFRMEDARPDDAGSAWVISYYLPLQQYGGLIRVFVAKDTGEVMVSYAVDPKPASLTPKS